MNHQSDLAPLVRPPAVTIRRFRAEGWTAEEAGNIAAYTVGLTPVADGWTLREINTLLMLRDQRGRWPG